MVPLVNLLVMLGMLVVVPLGLSLLGRHTAARLWVLPAVAGAASLWLHRGPLAVALAGLYAAAALALAATAVRCERTTSGLATATALVSPLIAATALLAERAGRPLFGFDLEILELTVPHFHYAGFAAALTAGLVSRSRNTFAALSVPGGTALVLAGYFIADGVELAGAAVLTAGMWAVALVTWREIRPDDRTTRTLFRISAATLVATMALAMSFAIGEAFDVPHLTHTWMAATHGVANALGFAVCGLLAWQRLERTPR